MSTSFSQSGRTALFHACWYGKTEVVRELLQRQADVNIPSEVSLSPGYPPLVLHTCPLFLPQEGLTPLITATKRGHMAVVELLLSSGKVDTEIQEQVPYG